jgi:hypothetical protein
VATNGKRAKWPSFGHGAIKHAPDAGSAQIKSLLQQRERSRHQFLRYLAELTLEAGMIVRVHAALKDSGVGGPIKEPSRDAQSSDLITGKPSGTNLFSLCLHAVHRRRKYTHCR